MFCTCTIHIMPDIMVKFCARAPRAAAVSVDDGIHACQARCSAVACSAVSVFVSATRRAPAQLEDWHSCAPAPRVMPRALPRLYTL